MIETISPIKMRSLQRLQREVHHMNGIVRANPLLQEEFNYANRMAFLTYYNATRDMSRVIGELVIKRNNEMKILADGIVETIKR